MLAVGLAVEQEFQELRRRNKIAEAKAQAIQHTQEKESTRRTSTTIKKALLLSKAQYRTPFTQVSESELKRLLMLYPYEALKQDEEEAKQVHPVTEEDLREYEETEEFLCALNKRRGLTHTPSPVPRPFVGLTEKQKKQKEGWASLFLAATSQYIADSDFLIIEEKLDAFLELHGIQAPQGEQEKQQSIRYASLAHDVFMQEIKIQKAILSRLHGDWVDTPAHPRQQQQQQQPSQAATPTATASQADEGCSSSSSKTPAPDNPRFADLWREWQKVMGAKPSTIANYTSAIRRFVEMTNNIPVKAITPDIMHQFKKALLRLPTHMPTALQKKPLPAILEWVNQQEKAGKLDELELMSGAAINKRGIAAISTVCKYAVKERYISTNPCAGITVEAYEDNQRRRNKGSLIDPVTAQRTNARLPYSVEDLKAIFAGNLFTGTSGLGRTPRGNKRHSAEEKALEYRWLILLGMFTGARIEELGQVLIEYIEEDKDTGQLYLFIRPDPVTSWTPKTEEGSIRYIPIHPRLIELGFRQFIAHQKRKGARKLFKDIHTNEEALDRTNAFSQWWSRYTQDIGVKTGKAKSFHSFRHGLEFFLLNEARVNDSINKALLGHKETGVHENYGRLEHGGRYTRQVLAEEISKLKFGGAAEGEMLEKVMHEGL